MITCNECKGDCCRRIAVYIPKPRSKADFEDIKWYLYHEGISVYIDNEDEWLVVYPAKCMNLKQGKCMIYDHRPPVCRDAKVSECERNIKEVKVLFENVEDLERYRKNIGR